MNKKHRRILEKYRKTTKLHINLCIFSSVLFIITKRLPWYQGEKVQRQHYPPKVKTISQ